ncbi:hypothetical protein NB706_002038 [Xanthomonas sacchari]|nr:hypothetical protein [Xanthomonas sacchari]
MQARRQLRALRRAQQTEQVLAPPHRSQQAEERDRAAGQRVQRFTIQFEIVVHHQCRIAAVTVGQGAGRRACQGAVGQRRQRRPARPLLDQGRHPAQLTQQRQQQGGFRAGTEDADPRRRRHLHFAGARRRHRQRVPRQAPPQRLRGHAGGDATVGLQRQGQCTAPLQPGLGQPVEARQGEQRQQGQVQAAPATGGRTRQQVFVLARIDLHPHRHAGDGGLRGAARDLRLQATAAEPTLLRTIGAEQGHRPGMRVGGAFAGHRHGQDRGCAAAAGVDCSMETVSGSGHAAAQATCETRA